MDNQGLNLNASFWEKIEKGMHNHHPKTIGPKPTSRKFNPFRVLLNWPCGSECTFVFGCRLDSSSRVFWPVLVPRRIFILCLRFFISFLDNSRYLRTIILQINTLKLILIKFRLSTILLLSIHPFYSYACIPVLNTNYQPITKLFR